MSKDHWNLKEYRKQEAYNNLILCAQVGFKGRHLSIRLSRSMKRKSSALDALMMKMKKYW